MHPSDAPPSTCRGMEDGFGWGLGSFHPVPKRWSFGFNRPGCPFLTPDLNRTDPISPAPIHPGEQPSCFRPRRPSGSNPILLPFRKGTLPWVVLGSHPSRADRRVRRDAVAPHRHVARRNHACVPGEMREKDVERSREGRERRRPGVDGDRTPRCDACEEVVDVIGLH